MKTSQFKDVIFFVTGIAILGSVFYVLLSGIMPMLQAVTAVLSAWLMTLLGVPAVFTPAMPPLIEFGGKAATIIALCVGDFEIAIVAAAILSTRDRSLLYRIEGAFASFFFVLFFNPIRIAITLSSWEWFGLETLEFLHSNLFRLTIIIVLVGFYGLWYSWPQIRGKLKSRR